MIRDAFWRSQQRADGVHLGLQHIGGSVLWDFQPGMRIEDISFRLNRLIATPHPLPSIIVFHCGGNNIGQTRLSFIVSYLKALFDNLISQFPNILFVWSAILPRLKFRNEQSHNKLEKTRKRINSCIGAYLIRKGGAYIQYHDIVETSELFRDNTHLSELGNDIFLNILQGALYNFYTLSNRYFP